MSKQGKTRLLKEQIGKCRYCGRVGSIRYRGEWDIGDPAHHFCRLADGGCGEQQVFLAATPDEISEARKKYVVREY